MVLTSLIQEVEQLQNQIDIAYGTKVSRYEFPDEESDLAKVILGDGAEISTNLIVSISHLSKS